MMIQRLSTTSLPQLRQQLVAPTIVRSPALSRLVSTSPRSNLRGRASLRHNDFRRYYSKDVLPSNARTSPTDKVEATAAATLEETKPKLSKFRQYAEQFKNKPASHLISFGILHEITAVVPLPIVYFALVETGVKIPFPEQAMEEGNRFVQRVAKYYGWNLEGADGARMMLNMATSYAVVKALMPLRLALCVWMTPWTATRIISPMMNFWRRFKK